MDYPTEVKRTWAKLQVGDILRTRDGRKVGNGIIIKACTFIYRVKTDFGNIMVLRGSEIREKYHLPTMNTDIYQQYHDQISLFESYYKTI